MNINKYKSAIINSRQEIVIIAMLIFLALIIRMWRINEFAIFLSDQAIDSEAVKNITEGNLTLLGPRASVGQFFNGPTVYYLMLPFYFLLRSDPLAGTIFQIFFQIAAIPFIYILGKRMCTKLTGYLAVLMFTLSPLFVYYSKSAFNSYPAIFLVTIILYLLTISKNKYWLFLIAGLMTGMLVQTHYLLYVYAFFYFIYVATSGNLKKIVFFILGAFFGLSPFLLFEVRNNFFNTTAIFKHVVGGEGENIDIFQRITQFSISISQIFGYNDVLLGIVFFAIYIFALFLYSKKECKPINLYFISTLALVASLVVYSGTIQSHYLIGIQPVFVLLIAYFATSKKLRMKYSLVVSLLLTFCMVVNLGKNYVIPREQDGFGLIDQRKAANIIERVISEIQGKNGNVKWNVTQDLQRDNRAMPIRYLLALNKSVVQPLSVENYSSNSLLFLIVPSDKKPQQVKTWEYESFGKKYNIFDKYIINKEVTMYLLKK